MKTTYLKLAGAAALLLASAGAFASNMDCCSSLECCLNMLRCCF